MRMTGNPSAFHQKINSSTLGSLRPCPKFSIDFDVIRQPFCGMYGNTESVVHDNITNIP